MDQAKGNHPVSAGMAACVRFAQCGVLVGSRAVVYMLFSDVVGAGSVTDRQPGDVPRFRALERSGRDETKSPGRASLYNYDAPLRAGAAHLYCHADALRAVGKRFG